MSDIGYEGKNYHDILNERDRSKGHGYFIEKYGKKGKAKGRALSKLKKK